MNKLRCPKCGEKIEAGYDGVCWCLNQECSNSRNDDKYYYGTNGFDIAKLWQERCIKAEAELQEVKGFKEKIKYIWSDGEYFDNAKETIELLKEE